MARRKQAGLAALSVAVLAAGLAAGAPAQAASSDIDGATLTWAVNDESGGGAYFGGCNFLSAGAAGDTGRSRVWTEADGFYAASAGNVSLSKPVDGVGQVAPTWATKCQNPAGQAVGTGPGSTTGTSATFAQGAGEVDLDAGTAEVEWNGSVTVVFYGGMTYWTFSDPRLSVAGGQGTVTATASGFGASMDDPDVWTAITPQTVTLATLSSVTLSADGFQAQPDYLGVEVTPASGAQTRTGEYWGSFPQDFVTFQALTGQSSYWYSSGGAADPKKVAKPISVEWQLSAPPEPAPAITVSHPTVPSTGATSLTVSGSGFDPASSIATRPPLAGQPGGVYVAFGKFASVWKPSEGAGAATRPNAGVKWAVLAEHVATIGGEGAGGIVLNPDGTFTATLEISKEAADSAGVDGGVYGIYTYAGGGAVTPSFETFTPVTFLNDGDIPIEVTVPEEEPPLPPEGEFTWTIPGSAAVIMGTAVQDGDVFAATGNLPVINVTDTRTTAPAWTMSGQVSDFVGGGKSFGGQALGWVPAIGANTVDAVAGAAVAPGAGGTGLTSSRTLAGSALGHALGSAQVTAGLSLAIPLATDAGDYTGVLTLTAIG
ncbi:MAG: HtaA domain-containing protein [Bifidobacteriaceae bacterium]|jgi:hypothetical protein|nr:HtaA domain-containing protein [Bifidobacteriaceae bacterium]